MLYFFIGMIVFALAQFLFSWLFGGTGAFIFLMLMFGFLGYQHGMVGNLQARVEELEKRNGIDPDEDFHMSNEEIEEELEREMKKNGQPDAD